VEHFEKSRASSVTDIRHRPDVERQIADTERARALQRPGQARKARLACRRIAETAGPVNRGWRRVVLAVEPDHRADDLHSGCERGGGQAVAFDPRGVCRIAAR